MVQHQEEAVAARLHGSDSDGPTRTDGFSLNRTSSALATGSAELAQQVAEAMNRLLLAGC